MDIDIIEIKSYKEPKATIINLNTIPKYRGNSTFKSETFNYINLNKILISKEVCINLPSTFGISEIPIVVYYLNFSIRTTLLTINNLFFISKLMNSLKTPNSIKCCCNRYNDSFKNNRYCHIIKGT